MAPFCSLTHIATSWQKRVGGLAAANRIQTFFFLFFFFSVDVMRWSTVYVAWAHHHATSTAPIRGKAHMHMGKKAFNKTKEGDNKRDASY